MQKTMTFVQKIASNSLYSGILVAFMIFVVVGSYIMYEAWTYEDRNGNTGLNVFFDSKGWGAKLVPWLYLDFI